MRRLAPRLDERRQLQHPANRWMARAAAFTSSTVRPTRKLRCDHGLQVDDMSIGLRRRAMAVVEHTLARRAEWTAAVLGRQLCTPHQRVDAKPCQRRRLVRAVQHHQSPRGPQHDFAFGRPFACRAGQIPSGAAQFYWAKWLRKMGGRFNPGQGCATTLASGSRPKGDSGYGSTASTGRSSPWWTRWVLALSRMACRAEGCSTARPTFSHSRHGDARREQLSPAAKCGRINEALAHTDPPLEDAIELHNPTASPVSITGWYLSNSRDNLRKYQITNTAPIPAGGLRGNL